MRIDYDLPMRDYQESPELSASQVRQINTNPHRWHHNLDAPRTTSPAMNLGSAVHSLILDETPDAVRLDVDNYRTNEARQARDAALAAGKYPLTAAEWTQATDMADAARRNQVVRRYMATGDPEVSFFTKHPSTGHPMRGRTDWVNTDHQTILDFKTTDSADPSAFCRVAGNLGYDVPAAHYGDSWGMHAGTDPWRVLFVLIERTRPHTVSVCELNVPSLDHGRREITRAVHTYRQATMTGQWSDPWPGINTIELPNYIFYAEA